jgi:hypothetical protein
MRYSLRGIPALLSVLLALTLAIPASAQKPQIREGFWIGFGFGYGGLDITCDGCEVDRENGVSGYLKLGGSLSQNVLLGVQSLGWYKDIEGVDLSQGSLTGNVWWYPSATGGFWLTGGAGLSRLEVDAGPLGQRKREWIRGPGRPRLRHPRRAEHLPRALGNMAVRVL